MKKGQKIKDSSGKDRSNKSMMKLLPDDIAKLNLFINTQRGPYLRIKEKTGIARQTVVDGLLDNGLFAIPTLFKLKDFIRLLESNHAS